ncbi:MAG: NAD(P)-dependent oxidoreductase [Planctomycetes bacterium]|nr:NAD(P)-dependent oxidoreductase [Planctomycetota bacterium]
MRVLVLGSTGFLGRLALAELRAAGHAVEAWSRGAADVPARGERRVDLARDELPVPSARPDAALCLAGPAVPARFTAGVEGAETLSITSRVLEHLERHAPGARLVLVSSAHVLAPSAARLAEDAARAPQGDYGAAKARAEDLALAAGGLEVVVARLFGSLGPGLPRGLLVPELLAELARGARHVRLAGPDGARDWMDGRDVARALRLLLEHRHVPGRIVHVGTGRATRASELAARLARAVGSRARIEFAPGEAPARIADPARLVAVTGSDRRRDLDDTLAWIVRGTRGLGCTAEDPPAQGVQGPA